MILDNWLMIMGIPLIFGDVKRKHKKKEVPYCWQEGW
jgi:hypothetical protein